jgi:hypothetical protein
MLASGSEKVTVMMMRSSKIEAIDEGEEEEAYLDGLHVD